MQETHLTPKEMRDYLHTGLGAKKKAKIAVHMSRGAKSVGKN